MFGNTEKEKEWFSNWQAQQQKFQQEQQQKQESFMSSVLDEVRKATQKLNTPYSETIYLQTSQVYNFASQGYPYNGIYIDNSLSSLQIAYRGLTYSLAISEGWNQLNLPDGAQVTPNVSASVVLVRSQVQFNPGLETVAVDNFPTTQNVDVTNSPTVYAVTQNVNGNVNPSNPLATNIENSPTVFTVLQSVTPKLIATIPYSDFTTASANIYPYHVSVLTRSARARTFMVYNTMNQPLTANSLAFYDSALGISGQPGIAQTAVFTAAGSDAVSTVTSESASASSQGLVASHVDSFQAILGIGATLPTSGNVYIYVSELI